MNILITLTVIFAGSQAFQLSELEEQQWQNFKVEYSKNYDTEEEENMRKEIFAKNLKEYEEHNKKYEEGLVLYAVGVNQFADITPEEIDELFPPIDDSDMSEGLPFVPPVNIEIPTSIDWREKGAVTPVKRQGGCGSCYAFSATGALEGQMFLKTGKLVSLSEQNLVDCSRKFGNAGCKGGNTAKCYKYVKANGGINTENSYKYEAKNGECRYKPESSAGTISNFVRVQHLNETALKIAVATVGPISVGCNGKVLFSYKKGIIHDRCKTTVVNHALLAVGYGTENGMDYWIVKNSWEKRFGEKGYFRIIRDRNECGIGEYSSYPVV